MNNHATNLSTDPYMTGPFRQIADMETPLETIGDLFHALCMIAETLEAEEGQVVMRLAMLGLREYEEAMKLRRELFHLTHPRREELEKDGWPS